MIQTSKPHVSLTYVLNFTGLDKHVRFQQSLAESAFGGLVNGQSQQTNLPDDFDPTQPRIVFPSDTKSISISQTACHLSLNFANSGMSFANEIEISKKNITAFTTKALVFKPEFAAHALVLDLRYPSTDSNFEISEYLHDRFLKSAPVGRPASTVIQLGYSYEDLYLNLHVHPYEARKIPEMGPGATYIRADSLPVMETGIQIRIDVNNMLNFKPGANEGVCDKLMSAVERFMNERFDAVFGLSLP